MRIKDLRKLRHDELLKEKPNIKFIKKITKIIRRKKRILTNLKKLKAMCLEADLTEEATKRLILKYVDKKTYKEIANIEVVTEEAIKHSIRISRAKLNI